MESLLTPKGKDGEKADCGKLQSAFSVSIVRHKGLVVSVKVEFIDREAWGGGPLRAGHNLPHDRFTMLVVHHTVIVQQDYDRDGYLHGDRDDVIRYMQQLQHARPDLGDEVPYSFVVFYGKEEQSCIIAEGRGWGVTGAHTEGYNSKAYGIAFAGNFNDEVPSIGMLDGVRWLGSKLADPLHANPTLGHRDTKATACPGQMIYSHMNYVQPPFLPDQVIDPTSPIANLGDDMDMYVEVTDTLLQGSIYHLWWRDTADGRCQLVRKHVVGVEWEPLQHKYQSQLVMLPWSSIQNLAEVPE